MDRRRKIARWCGALAALVLAATIGLREVSQARCFTLSGQAICRVETDAPVVALTFDDGPTPEGVEAALAALRRAGAKATFFLIGSQVEGREELVRRLVADGHEIGNHSYSHVRMMLRPSAFYDAEIERTDAVLRRAGAPPPRLFRPPFGKKLIGLPRAIDRQGYRMIMWDVEEPRRPPTPQDYAARIVREARPGSILLMHVMYRGNAVAREALPLVLQGLQERGFRVVTVGELLNRQR